MAQLQNLRSRPDEKRRVVAIACGFGILVAVLLLASDLDDLYEKHRLLQHALEALVATLGSLLAYLEYRHSGEANEHRSEANRLSQEIARAHDEANKYRAEAVQVSKEVAKYQAQVYVLQESIEKKLTKVRLYARVRQAPNAIELLVSNLSEFDLWINQVVLVVTEAMNAKPDSRVIGGGNRISSGSTDSGYLLYGNLMGMNNNSLELLDMTFNIDIEAVGVTDDPAKISSPRYHLVVVGGKITQLEVLEYL